MNEETLFHLAKQKAPAERAAYLDEVCPDAAVRRRVELLLDAHDNPGSFMGEPVVDPGATLGQKACEQVGTFLASPTAADVPVGQMIGRYKLLQLIGEGGFGTVYMAEQQQPVFRKVALKIIKLGMDIRQVIARFEAERQALAMMDHPNIAKVLDAGATDSGRPYFVMELVKGISITQYCDQAKLSTKQRLTLFMDVCGAVQHAHQKGVIHRDLKPSNVMVTLRDDKPNVKVIDFGIAKATEQKLTEKTLFTAYGQMIGTPVYMSPEQAVISEVDVDTRSDVYSLGVLLYELLMGSPPFDAQTLRSAGFDEMRRIIREQPPQKPSTKLSTLGEEIRQTVAGQRQASPAALGSQLHGDLDWIVLKAIEKDRARRYESASAFAQDIQRHLDAQPVMAAAPSASYLLRKFIRRNRAPMTVAAALALLLLAGTAVSTWQAIRATRANAEAVAAAIAKGKALDAANTAKAEAVAANEQARKRLMQVEKANEIMGSIFENLTPQQIALADRPLQAILAEKLDRAGELLEGEAIGDPLVVAAMQHKFGRALWALGEDAKAIVLLERAAATREEKLGPDHPDTLACMSNLATAYAYAGKLDQALPLAEETLKRVKARFGPDHSRTLDCMDCLAGVYHDAGRWDLALPLLEETFKRRQANLGPGDVNTVNSMGRLASGYLDAGKLELAVPLLENALKFEKTSLGPEHPDTLCQMHALAMAYKAAGKLDLALPLFEENFKLSKAKLGPDHPSTITSMASLAQAYQDVGKLDLALPLFEEAFKLSKAHRGPENLQGLAIMGGLASACLDVGKLDEALPLFEETLKLTKAKRGPDHPETLICMSSLASGYLAVGKLDEAQSLFEETLKLYKAKLGPDHPATLTCMNNLAAAYKAAGKLDLALPLFEESLKLTKAKLGFDHPETLNGMHNLASAYNDAGKLDLAVPLSEETFMLTKAKLGPDHPATLNCMNTLAAVYWSTKQLDKSVPLFEETLKRREAMLGRQHPKTLLTVADMGVNYKDAGRLEEALPLLEEGHRAAKQYPQLRFVDAQLVDGYLRAGKTAQATALGKEILADARTTLKEMDALAGVFTRANRLGLALPVFEETVKLKKAKLGPDHPDTLNAMAWLGLAYQAAGEANLALTVAEETLKLTKAKLGPDHPDTLRSMENLAAAYLHLGKLDVALPLFEETLERHKARLGPDHLDTLKCMSNLGAAYLRAKQFDKSIPLLAETLKRREALLGRQNPDTLQSVADLGVTYKDAGRLDEALPLLEEGYRAAKQHAFLRGIETPLLEAYFQAGKTEQATTLIREMVVEARATLPKDSPQLAGQLASLSLSLLRAKAFADAEPLLRECVAIRKNTQPEDWSTFNTQSMLGGALLGLKKYDAAEPLLVEGYDGMNERAVAIPEAARPRLTESLERLISLYESRGGADDAKQAAAYRELLDRRKSESGSRASQPAPTSRPAAASSPHQPEPVEKRPLGPATAPLVLDASSLAELKQRIGQEVTLEGLVKESQWSKDDKHLEIRFRGEQENSYGMVCVVPLENRAAFDAAFSGDAAAAFSGAFLRVYGTLIPYGGKHTELKDSPEIELNDPRQVTIIK